MTLRWRTGFVVLAVAVLSALTSGRGVAQPAPAPSARPEGAPSTWGTGAAASASAVPVVPHVPPTPARDGDRDADEDEPSDVEQELQRQEENESVARSGSAAIRYELERVEVRGALRTRPRVILRYVPFKAGDPIDVDDPEVELTRYRLLGTGFFRDVQFSLKRGSARGHVILVIDVEERNTIVLNDVWLGLGADADGKGRSRPLTAYGGLELSETNLAGTGITLGGAIGLARDQLALRVRFLDPAFVGTRWMTSGSLIYNDARDYFGSGTVSYAESPDPSVGLSPEVTDYAPLAYKRFGGSVGLGRDLGVATQLWFTYRLERIDADVPIAATTEYGTLRAANIDFDIAPGASNLSVLRAAVQHDTRDQPVLPTRGWLVSTAGELALGAMGSDYDYERIEFSASRWWRLPWKEHVVRLTGFAGAITGDAPFFEQYYVGDFSDFRPPRVLGMALDRRPAPNFFDTSIAFVRFGEYAARLGAEYRIPLYRGHRSVFGIDFFTSAGLFGVAPHRFLSFAPPGYSGAARLPIDFTANLGFRMDTSSGGFVFALSNVLGFIPVRSESR